MPPPHPAPSRRRRALSHHRWRLAKAVEHALGGLALGAFRRPVWTLLAVVVALAASAVGLRRLSLDTDLVELLPHSFRSVQDLERMRDRFGSVGYVTVLGMNAPAEQLRQFARDVAPRLEALPEIRYVEWRRPVEFFQDHALYYLDVADLEEIHRRLEEREGWERQSANPLFVDLEDTGPPSVDFSDIIERYRERTGGDLLTEDQGSFYLDEERGMVALLARPMRRASNLAYSRQVVGEVEGALAGLDLARYGPEFRVELTGTYKKKIDQQEVIMGDLTLASSLALVLMVVYLAFHFRRLGAVLLVFVPLVTGLAWALGFAGFTFGTLNILTGFIGAILLGLGVDHGIHLLGRYEAEIADGHAPPVAIRSAFSHTGRAVLVAALTTAMAFGGLAISEFRAFREFGVIASVGLLLVVTAYLGLLPALLALACRVGWRPAPRPGRRVHGSTHWLARHGGLLFSGFLAAMAVLAVFSVRVSFDYDFSALEDNTIPSFVLDEEVNRLIGYSQTPVVAMAESAVQERAIVRELESRRRALGETSTIDFVTSEADLVPLDQPQKAEVIARIRDTLEGVDPDRVDDPETRRDLERARRMAQARPFGRDELPVELQRRFEGRPEAAHGEGADGSFVLIYPSINLSDGMRVVELAREVRGVPLPGGGEVSAAGEPMVLADILQMVAREAPPVLGLTLVLVFLTMWSLLGSLRIALLCMVPAVATMVGTFGLITLAGVPLNYLNIVMIPVLFGIAVDGGLHLVSRAEEAGGLEAGLENTGRAIAGALLTTGLGFGALLLANHHGLNSLGVLALLGLSANALSTLVGLPALLAWRPGLAAVKRAAGRG